MTDQQFIDSLCDKWWHALGCTHKFNDKNISSNTTGMIPTSDFKFENLSKVDCKIHGKSPTAEFRADGYPDIIVCAKCYFDKITEGLEKFTRG